MLSTGPPNDVAPQPYAPHMLLLHHDPPFAGSLVAMLRLQQLADEGLDVAFRGHDVLGVDVTLPATLDDLEDWERHRAAAADLGWDLPRPCRHPSTLSCHLVGLLAEEHGLDTAWRLATYRAHWQEDLDLGDTDVLVALAEAVGLKASDVAALVTDPDQRHRLRRVMLVHRGEGVGGVPVLVWNRTFLSPFVPISDLRELAAL